MASQWFYQIDGEKVGPVSSQQLRQLAGEGRIQTTTLIWREGIGDWVEAQRVKGLFSDVGDSGVALSGILKRGPTTPTSHLPAKESREAHDASDVDSAHAPSRVGARPAPKQAPSQWFYKCDDKKVGPVSSKQLKQLADGGRIEPVTLVWREGIGDWVEAKQVKGLFSDTLDDHAAALSGIGKRMPQPIRESVQTPKTDESNESAQAAADSTEDRKEQARSEPASTIAETGTTQIPTSEENRRTPIWIWGVVEAAILLLICFGWWKYGRYQDEVAKTEARALLSSAESKITKGDTSDAVALLNEYLSHPGAEETVHAQRLLDDANSTLARITGSNRVAAIEPEHEETPTDVSTPLAEKTDEPAKESPKVEPAADATVDDVALDEHSDVANPSSKTVVATESPTIRSPAKAAAPPDPTVAESDGEDDRRAEKAYAAFLEIYKDPDKSSATKMSALEDLAKHGRHLTVAIPFLVTVYGGDDERFRTVAWRILTEIGEASVPALSRMLKEWNDAGNLDHRRVAEVCSHLRKLGPVAKGAAPVLLEIADTADASQELNLCAIYALGALMAIQPDPKLSTPTMRRIIKRQLTDPTWYEDQKLHGSIMTLSQDPKHAQDALDELIAIVSLPSGVNRETVTAAINLLGEIGPSAAAALPKLRAHLDGRLGKEAEKAIERIKTASPIRDAEAVPNIAIAGPSGPTVAETTLIKGAFALLVADGNQNFIPLNKLEPLKDNEKDGPTGSPLTREQSVSMKDGVSINSWAGATLRTSDPSTLILRDGTQHSIQFFQLADDKLLYLLAEDKAIRGEVSKDLPKRELPLERVREIWLPPDRLGYRDQRRDSLPEFCFVHPSGVLNYNFISRHGLLFQQERDDSAVIRYSPLATTDPVTIDPGSRVQGVNVRIRFSDHKENERYPVALERILRNGAVTVSYSKVAVVPKDPKRKGKPGVQKVVRIVHVFSPNTLGEIRQDDGSRYEYQAELRAFVHAADSPIPKSEEELRGISPLQLAAYRQLVDKYLWPACIEQSRWSDLSSDAQVAVMNLLAESHDAHYKIFEFWVETGMAVAQGSRPVLSYDSSDAPAIARDVKWEILQRLSIEEQLRILAKLDGNERKLLQEIVTHLHKKNGARPSWEDLSTKEQLAIFKWIDPFRE